MTMSDDEYYRFGFGGCMKEMLNIFMVSIISSWSWWYDIWYLILTRNQPNISKMYFLKCGKIL